ncbi:hypothetical protein K1719_039308 [Acacia pycnantha]|nr:hypothetical protein K1719_039308 [Acacia pycnantha]
MGTKIEHSINPLAVAVESNNFSISGVDVWEYYQKKRLTEINNNKLKKDPISMDRNIMESIKKTMQMQEDIFKHQVGELHRVYSVQKMLMEELKKENRQKNIWTAMNGLEISFHSHHHNDQQQQQQHQRRTQTSYDPNLQVQNLRDDYCSRERSGSCSGNGDTIKMPQRGIIDLARPAEEEDDDEGEAGPSCKIRNNGDDEEEDMEVDLTLSIGGSSNSQGKKKEKTNLLYSSASFKSDRGECSDPNTPMSSSSVTFDQERKGGTTTTHWLSQGLRLK